MCKCITCGAEGYPTNPSKFPSKFCSYACYEKWLRDNKKPNCQCVICGKPMYYKSYRLKRLSHGAVCSDECSKRLHTQLMIGENNHQFGLIGDKNASFSKKEIISQHGYIMEYCPGHPFPSDCGTKGTRVRQHRLVVERNWQLFDQKYFFEIDGQKYLKPDYDVHHINFNKQDNRIENLQILTRAEHTALHNQDKTIVRNDRGQIIGVIKSGNIGEGCDANPEINSQIKKVSHRTA